jgi:glycosyltransferase involved in cell wall biosynthesis
MDLHLFPSRSEGFPKVVLETAAAGVPSIVYADYGAGDWLSDGADGVVVETLADVEEVLKELSVNSQRLRKLSLGARRLAERYDWKHIAHHWDEKIRQLARRGGH